MTFFLLSWWNQLSTWWQGTTIGQEVDTAAKAAITELEQIGPSDLEGIVEAVATAVLPGITGGAATGAIISAGIIAAETAFKNAAATVSSTTVSTFVSTLHNSISAQQTVVATKSAS